MSRNRTDSAVNTDRMALWREALPSVGGGLGFDSRTDEIGHNVVHRCDVTAKLCCLGAKPRKRAPPLVTRFLIIPRVVWRFAVTHNLCVQCSLGIKALYCVLNALSSIFCVSTDSDSSEDDDVSDTESIFSRMEDIREELERRLGLEKLKQVYRYVQVKLIFMVVYSLWLWVFNAIFALIAYKFVGIVMIVVKMLIKFDALLLQNSLCYIRSNLLFLKLLNKSF